MILRKLILIIIIIAFGKNIKAQIKNNRIEAFRPNKVLIVSFFPEMYLVDDEHRFAKANNKDHKQILNYFRQSLDNEIIKVIGDSIRCISLLNSSTESASDDLTLIYQNARYDYVSPMQMKFPKNKVKYYIKPKDIETYQKHKSRNSIKDGQIESKVVDRNTQLFNISFKSNKLLFNLSKKYNNDYFLFINQFEIRSDYSNPYSSGSGTYPRKIKVHYSIFDAKGNFVFGSFAQTDLPPNENYLTNISKNYFPIIVKKIYQNSPFQ